MYQSGGHQLMSGGGSYVWDEIYGRYYGVGIKDDGSDGPHLLGRQGFAVKNPPEGSVPPRSLCCFVR